MLGTFLEISITTPDILASVQFYERLGLRQVPVGETWQHPYAVLSDGRWYLGLHRYDFPSPSLTFVLPGLRSHIQDLETLGVGFSFRKLAEEEFNEAGFCTPSGQMITLLEARTCSPLRPAPGNDSLCGYFREYRLAVIDPVAEGRFWEQLGFLPTGDQSPSAARVQLSVAHLNVGLQRSMQPQPATLVFVCGRLADSTAQFTAHGLDATPVRDWDGAAALELRAPERTRLLLRDTDY